MSSKDNSQDLDSKNQPSIPSDADRYEKTRYDGELVAFDYEAEEDGKYVHLRSENLDGLLGFSDQDVVDLLDRKYKTGFSGVEVENVEYGKGWALVSYRLDN